ncbi:MAG: Hsp70 family protein, partial [Planctomycetes bacterium]|nr:Hsp70 family protein [Planctomycetota bacterium]
GMPQIEVTFDIDANGILNVNAKDTATNKEQSIRITASTGLNEGEIKKMVKDAESFAEKDKTRKELAETRNHADGLCYQMEKLLKDYAEKVSSTDKEKIEKGIEKLRKAKEGEDVAEIKRAMEELNRVSHEFSKALYEEAAKKRGGASAAPPPPQEEKGKGGDGGDEKVIDAEFRTK